MFEQKKYKQEIKRCRATIEEIERKRSRSQSALPKRNHCLHLFIIGN